jgi:proteasome lid subunit RPN8/RPN11
MTSNAREPVVTRPQDALTTPIYLKVHPEMAWPDDTFFYVLTSDGLFVCRNHKFFRSCVRARRFPSQLAGQEAFLQADYPKMPRRMIERIVGFFSEVAEKFGSEAAVLLAWDEPAQQIRVVVPEQVASVGRNWRGQPYPIDLKYEAPAQLPDGWVVIGDVHSHVDYWATPSYVDDQDETHRAGVHVIVGRIYSEPPEFHVEAVVDGQRFTLRQQQVMEGYRRRRTDNIPLSWFEKLKIKSYGSYWDKEDSEQSAAAATREGRDGGNGNGSARATSTVCRSDDEENETVDASLAQFPEPTQYPDSDTEDDPKEPPDDRA